MAPFNEWLISQLTELSSGGKVWPLILLIFTFFVLPGLCAALWTIVVRFYLLRKVENSYRGRLSDKDEEIKRLWQMIKRLEKKFEKND